MNRRENKLNQNKILIFCDYFWPGFRAGGPITTLKSTIEQLNDTYKFYTVSRNHDYKIEFEYDGINSDQWNKTPYGNVYYSSSRSFKLMALKNLLKDVNPDLIYLNSLFSFRFSILIIFYTKVILRNNIKIILCPRGELNPSALERGHSKKRLYLFFLKALNLHKLIFWQATNQREYGQIITEFGKRIKLQLAQNLTWGVKPEVQNTSLSKKVSNMKIIFIARINDIKNLQLLLHAIKNNKWNMELTIIGPIDEKNYWKNCKKIISSISESCKISYMGEVSNTSILRHISEHHFMCLPTKGENFGQIIYETLSIGRPVLISDQTPWLNLKEINAGFDVNINSTKGLEDALNKIYSLNDEDWRVLCKGALNLATNYNNTSRNKTLDLFNNALKD